MEAGERIPKTVPAPRRLKLAVVGAGVAGLSAAQWIVNSERGKGIDLAIYEASERIGGRIHSTKFGKGFVEKGAAWIHGCCSDNPLYNIAIKYKLGQVEKGVPRFDRTKLQQRTEHGDPVSMSDYKQLQSLFTTLLDDPKSTSPDDSPDGEPPSVIGQQGSGNTVGACVYPMWKHYLSQMPKTDSPVTAREMLRLLQQMVTEEFISNGCQSLYDIDVDGYERYIEYEGGDVGLTMGYGSLVDSMASEIPSDCLYLKHPVEKIEWMYHTDGHPPVRLHFKDGTTRGADFVLVTSSLGYLKHNADILFEPRLPEDKLRAIKNLGFGVINKIQMQYDKPFWDQDWQGIHLLWDCDSVEELEGTWSIKEEWFKRIAYVRRVLHSDDVIETLIAGREGEYIESLDANEIGKTVTGVLRRFLSDPSIPEPDQVIVTKWSSQPYIRGSYSYIGANGSCHDTDKLAEPIMVTDADNSIWPRICFAGEATSMEFYSTVHGALMTGQREADRILDFAESYFGQVAEISSQ